MLVFRLVFGLLLLAGHSLLRHVHRDQPAGVASARFRHRQVDDPWRRLGFFAVLILERLAVML